MFKGHSTFAMIKPRATREHLVDILRSIETLNFVVARLELRRLKRSEAEFLYEEHKGKNFYEPLIEYITSDSVVLMHLMEKNDKSDVVARWRLTVKGPGTVSLRQVYGNPAVPRENALHASDSHEAAKRELQYFWKFE